MTVEATEQTAEQNEAAEAVAALAAEAESAEQAEQRQAESEQQADQGEWEDVAAQQQQAKALAKMGVQGVELLAGLVNPGHSLDRQARDNGEEALYPVALDFSGEVPEWLRPYMHYLGAGLWIGGVLVGAVRAKAEKKAEEAEQQQRERAEGVADGIPS